MMQFDNGYLDMLRFAGIDEELLNVDDEIIGFSGAIDSGDAAELNADVGLHDAGLDDAGLDDGGLNVAGLGDIDGSASSPPEMALESSSENEPQP
jgi:hypothetical protein